MCLNYSYDFKMAASRLEDYLKYRLKFLKTKHIIRFVGLDYERQKEGNLAV